MSQPPTKPAATAMETQPVMPGPGGPGPGGRGGPMGFQIGKAKTENPRGILWKWIFSYLAPYWGRYSIYFCFLLVGTIVTAITPLITLHIIDDAILSRNQTELYSLIMLYVGLMILNGIVSYISQYGMNKIGQVVVLEVRKKLFSQLQKMSMAYFDKKLSGDILSIMTNDVDQLNLLVSGQLVQIINNFVQLGLFLLMMYLISPILATLALINFPIYLYLVKRFQTKAANAFKLTRRTISRVTSSIQENIAGAKVVQAYGQEKKATKEFDEANQANAAATVRVRKTFATFFTSINYITSLITSCIIFAGGIFFIDQFSFFGILITIGTVVSFISYLNSLNAPLQSFSQIQQTVETAMAASDRIYSLVNEQVDLLDPENPVPISDIKGEIEFKNVYFGYILEDPNKKNASSGSTSETDKNIPTKPAWVNASNPSGGSTNVPIKPAWGPGATNAAQNSPQNQGFSINVLPPFLQERIHGVMDAAPEPYRVFLETQLGKVSPEIRQSIIGGIMGSAPEEGIDKIDSVLEQFGYAVADSEFANSHPELKTEIEESSAPENQGATPHPTGSWNGNGMNGIGMPPEAMLQMAKSLEKPLRTAANANNVGMSSGGGMGGGDMGGSQGMPLSAAKGMVHTLASMRIPPEIYKQFPAIVKKALEEEKTLMERAVSVGYILENVSLHIEPGQTWGIVGETGAGKTTLIKLIARFYDVNQGSITIDGVDVRDVLKKDVRRMIGLVPQDSFMFKGTIRENLLYGIETPSPNDEDKMLEASKFLGLHNFIMTLPEQYGTPIMENASNLSIGQRQLMAFCRALITDPKILILDEATSSVDPYTETLIQDALDRARAGRTTIIIAHRLSTIKNADHIVVLSREVHGIVEEGTHEELMTIEDGHYRKLVELQSQEFGESA